ncbi:hypothetical protein HBE96_06565 [Clostridium sp. P21]|uniref:Phage replisome organiser N-terminal domain-containing protein n=1 Tax=Clostridium muellerianum TaxID=2716538 RepID=A0A7Y0HMN8_9CLOT|nr:hypothetical protein [Clostridium muellerianum]
MVKRYYWLKLKENFFEREEIKVIENSPNGKDYIIFYLKLLLKSISNEGKLKFRNIIPYTPEMLSSITATNVDTVRIATDLFIKLGLMEIWDDGTMFIVETQNMIGSESDSAARMRKLRNKGIKEIPSHCDDNVHNNDKSIQRSDIDIEKYTNIKLDKDTDEYKENEEKINSDFFYEKIIQLCKYYSELKCGESITSHLIELSIFIRDYKFEWCKEALKETILSTGKFVPNYMGKILKHWSIYGKPKSNVKKEINNNKKSLFNDFQQRDYVKEYGGFDELEKKLLGLKD